MSDDLSALRGEIDRIDESLHGLLMERGEIIDRLVAAKGTAVSGSAFRPEREAAMTRALLTRHRGRLPADAVEAIWRVIISTFTHVQAPFRVHAITAGIGGDAVRDSARFHFGFGVPLVQQDDVETVIAAVSASRGDLGLVPIGPDMPAGAWWRALEPGDAPKVIARLPFVERPDHPASRPVLVLTGRPSEEGLGAVVLRSATGLANTTEVPYAFSATGGRVLAAADGSALIAAPRVVPAETLAEALGARRIALLGSHPDPIIPDPA